MPTKFDAIRMRLDRMSAESAVDYPGDTAAALAALAVDIDALTAEDLRTEFLRVQQTMDPGERGLEPDHFRSAGAFFGAFSRALVRLANTLDGARQPAPKANDGPIVWERVIADAERKFGSTRFGAERTRRDSIVTEAMILDMKNRDRLGRERYGVALQPNNGRDALRDWYEEALDACAYGKQAQIEGTENADINYECSLDLAYDLRRMMAKRDAAKESAQ